jgi:ATP-dependent Clp protease adaptor protein ClpS
MSNEDWANDFFDVLDREKEEQQTKPPKQYNVLIMNDDFSTWPFVIEVLSKFFGKSEEEGHRITKEIHTKGKGLAGTYTKDIAETKAIQMNDYAQSKGHPLHAETEEANEN